MADDESLKDEMAALLRAAREHTPVDVTVTPEPEPQSAPAAEEPPTRGRRLRKFFR